MAASGSVGAPTSSTAKEAAEVTLAGGMGFSMGGDDDGAGAETAVEAYEDAASPSKDLNLADVTDKPGDKGQGSPPPSPPPSPAEEEVLVEETKEAPDTPRESRASTGGSRWGKKGRKKTKKEFWTTNIGLHTARI